VKKKTTQVAVVATLVALATIGTSVLAANKTNVLNGVFANVQTNDYGCAYNCTAEYYPSDAHAILKSNPTLSGTNEVRIIATASKPNNWFQDVTNETVYKDVKDATFVSARKAGKLVVIKGSVSGLKYEVGDTVAFWGTINYVPKSEGRYQYDTVEITNPTIYMVNDQIDFSLINKTAIYLQ